MRSGGLRDKFRERNDTIEAQENFKENQQRFGIPISKLCY